MTQEIILTDEQTELANSMIADAFKNKRVSVDYEKEDERNLSRAQRRMKERRKNRPDLVQPFEIEEPDGTKETWFVTALSHADINAIGILMAYDGYLIYDLTTEEAQRSYNAAILAVGLVVSETDLTKYFESHEEAKEFYDDGRETDYSMNLCELITQINPFFFNSKKKGAKVTTLPKMKKQM